MWMMNLRLFLGPMVDRLRSAGPKGLTQLYDNKTCVGGLGGVLLNFAGECCAWFSLRLEAGACQLLPASWIAMHIWSKQTGFCIPRVVRGR